MDKMLEDEIIIIDNQNELEINGQEEGQIYPMSGLKVDKGFYTIYELKRRYAAVPPRIVLDSDFQREEVWRQDRKSELIESVLMGLPLPIFYFNQDKYGRLIVVDGRQRLTAFFEYMDNEFPLRKLKILSDLNGKTFHQLSPLLQGRFEDFQIQAHVILPPTPDRIKFDIFDRVNRGGMPLNKQEIRNALYQGFATKLLNRLIESQEFKNATGHAFVKEIRMKDRYLLTRFIGLYLYQEKFLKDENGKDYIYRDDIDELLGKAMDFLNHMNQTEIQQLEEMIMECLEKSYIYLGEDAFRLTGGERRSPINMNVFETVMYTMYFVPRDIKSMIRRTRIKDEITCFLNSEQFRKNIDNHRDRAVSVRWRLSEAEKLGRSLGSYDKQIKD